MIRRILFPALTTSFGVLIALALIVALEFVFGELNQTFWPLRYRLWLNQQSPLTFRNKPKIDIHYSVPTGFSQRKQSTSRHSCISIPHWQITRSRTPDYEYKNFSHRMRPLTTYHRNSVGPDGSVFFTETFTTGADTYRHIDHPSKSATSSAIFLGCSVAFGEGLKDEETLPYLFEKRFPKFRGYNRAVSGYGPGHVLKRALNDPDQIPKEKDDGIIVYVHAARQLDRLLGSLGWLRVTRGYTPRFRIDGDGKLVHDKDFARSAPFLVWLAHRETLKFFDYDFPRTEGRLLIFESVIRKIREHYRKILPHHRFYYVLYPQEPHADILVPILWDPLESTCRHASLSIL